MKIRLSFFVLIVFGLLGFIVGPQLASAKTIVVVAPHPGDEALMASGVIYAAKQRGDTVKVVVVTNGDQSGVSMGQTRQGETVNGMATLGVSEQDIIFLGYGDGLLLTLYQSASATTVYTSAAGRTQTYASRGLGSVDYHTFLNSVAGSYNRQTILGDFKSALTNLHPDEIYTTSFYDDNTDNRATYGFLAEALVSLQRGGATLAPRIHETLVHAPCEFCDQSYHWPMPVFTPTDPFPEPSALNSTPYRWNLIETVPVPGPMQSTSTASNLKWQAISAHATQTGGSASSWWFSFVKKDEIFWIRDFGMNIARIATVTASTQASGTNQTGLKAVDGILSGYPFDPEREWATTGQTAGAWLRLDWPSAMKLSRVAIYDRPNSADNVLTSHLEFSDGSVWSVGALPTDGSRLVVSFTPRNVSWVRFVVDSAAGKNVGLAEIEVFGRPASASVNTPPGISSGPIATPPEISPSQTSTLSVSAFDVDGDAIQYSWTSDGGSVTGNGSTATFTPPSNSPSAYYTVTATADDGHGGSIQNSTFVKVTPASQQPISLGGTSSVTVSSENAIDGQLGIKAVDGVIDGYPGDFTKEWATVGQTSGAWIQLNWSAPVTLSKIILHDRPNASDNILSGTLSFSDGSTLPVGQLPNDGTGLTLNFSARAVTNVRLQVNSAAGKNIGLAELEVFGVPSSGVFVSSVSVNPSSVEGGTGSQGTVTLNNPAPSGGASVSLSSNSSSATVPASVNITQGNSSATFNITTSTVSVSTPAAITASLGGVSQSTTLTVLPVVALSSLSLNPTSVVGGNSSQGTVTLTGVAPSGGTQVSLSTNSPTLTTLPGSVTIPGGSSSAQFTINTSSVASTTTVQISALFRSVTKSANLQLNPVGSGPVLLGGSATVTVSSENSSTGQLGVKAVDGVLDGYPGDFTKEWATVQQLAGAWIQLTWSSPVTISTIVLHDRPNTADNVLSGTLSFNTGANIAVGALPNNGSGSTVNVNRTVTFVRFTVNSAAGANIGLEEFEVFGQPSVVMLSGLTVSPATVTGGTAAQGTVTLNGSAPSGGASVTLSSNDPVASVPASVTVPAGALSANFSISTSAPSTFKTVTIGGSYNGGSASAPLNVQPAGLNNIALTAYASASSESPENGQLATKAIDGVIDGYPGDFTKEWSTTLEQAGAWLRLDWSYVTLSDITLYDRPNTADNVLGGNLVFSDGSTIAVGALPNNGTGMKITFNPKTISWVRFDVTSAAGKNVGLAEIQATGQCAVTPSVRLANPKPLYLQASSSLTVDAATCLGSAQQNWGVRFALDGGSPAGGSEINVTAPPYRATFNNVLKGEHTVDVYLLDSTGVVVAGTNTHDQVSQIAIGNYFVGFGDSITHGFGDTDATDNTSADGRVTGGGYEPVLNNQLTTYRNYPQLVADEGLGGEKASEAIVRVQSMLHRHPKAETVLLQYGTNDALALVASGQGLVPGNSGYAGSFKDSMQQIINAVRATGKKVALAKVPVTATCTSSCQINQNSDTNLRIRQYNTAIDELVSNPANAITIVPPDSYSYFSAHPSEFFDSLHPNGTGYRSLSNLWFTAITNAQP